MKFFYYPGCSLEGSAREYDLATRAVAGTLGVELMELEGWTCCGASPGDAVSPLLSIVLPARNLALLERTGLPGELMTPCSSCYLNLKRADAQMRRSRETFDDVNTALGEDQLHYSGGKTVRHLLDVLANDVGPDRIEEQVKCALSGLRVAPYYGCQVLRPYGNFDDPEQPRSMEPLLRAVGAEVHFWSAGARCCGAGLMTTKKDLALELTADILRQAQGADCIVTVCPMCQMNLESHQNTVSRLLGESVHNTILYLPQLLGLAFGIPMSELGLEHNLAVASSFKKRIRNMENAGH